MASGAKMVERDMVVLNNENLKSSAEKINIHMMKVTEELEWQCSALEMIVAKLQCSCDSTEKIQALIDAWCKEGEGVERSKAGKMRFRLWLETRLPQEMSELSQYCNEYLGDENRERCRLMDALNMPSPQPVAQAGPQRGPLRLLAGRSVSSRSEGA
jgi:hypothetical protein